MTERPGPLGNLSSFADLWHRLPAEPLTSLDDVLSREARLFMTVERLRVEADQQSQIIDRQANHIAMLEQQLAANGRRAQARLRRSGWWTWRGMRALLARLPL